MEVKSAPTRDRPQEEVRLSGRSIAPGLGMGRAWVVGDVLKFPGHIACDAASRSEIVVPLKSGGLLLGVLDVDAPFENRFDDEDRAGLEEFARVLMPGIESIPK